MTEAEKLELARLRGHIAELKQQLQALQKREADLLSRSKASAATTSAEAPPKPQKIEGD